MQRIKSEDIEEAELDEARKLRWKLEDPDGDDPADLSRARKGGSE
jgi:hypothetical protein